MIGDEATVVELRGVDRLGNVEDPPGRLPVPGDGIGSTPSATAATAPDTTPLGRPLPVRVRVTGDDPTGRVTVLEGTRALASAALRDGRAVVSVPTTRLGVGRHRLTVRYAGDAVHAASSDTVAVRVVRAASRTTVAAPARTTTARQVPVTVRVGVGDAGRRPGHRGRAPGRARRAHPHARRPRRRRPHHAAPAAGRPSHRHGALRGSATVAPSSGVATVTVRGAR